MNQANLKNKFLLPTFLALMVMLISRLIFINAFRINSEPIYHSIAILSGAVQSISIVFISLILYPLLYFKGATIVERVTACSINLAAWIVFDAYHVSQAFTFLESLYYGLFIGSILFTWTFALMGILEFTCRAISKQRGEQVRVVTAAPFIPIVLFLFVIYLLSKNGGADVFNRFLDGYLVLYKKSIIMW